MASAYFYFAMGSNDSGVLLVSDRSVWTPALLNELPSTREVSEHGSRGVQALGSISLTQNPGL